MDHIVPQAAAGGDEPENLALCCKSCNIRKSGHISGKDPESREETVLFNPREDTWNEHFDFDAGRFQLLGRTPTGRATIDQLRMNTSYQMPGSFDDAGSEHGALVAKEPIQFPL